MLIKNLDAVTATAFAATPQDPKDAFQNLRNLLENSPPLYINADGTIADSSHHDESSVSQNPGSSLNDLLNVPTTRTWEAS